MDASSLPVAALEALLGLCEEQKLVIFDLETTGADRLSDRVIEIAAVRVVKGAAVATLERRVNPGIKIPRESTAVHGISDDHVRDQPAFAAIAAEVADFFDGADLAGYNLRSFDIPVLQKEFERAAHPFSIDGRLIVDIQTIFFKKEPRDLSAAVRIFAGREHTGAHSALADALAAAEVLAGQLQRYADLPRSLAELHDFSTPAEGRWVDPDKRFFWRDGEAVFAFGEHRGRPLSEVAQKNPGFLDWMLARDFPARAKEIARNALRGIFPKKAG